MAVRTSKRLQEQKTARVGAKRGPEDETPQETPAPKKQKSKTITKTKERKENAQPSKKVEETKSETQSDGGGGHSYWLMKAEPESRIESGVDVKFSIDDLEAATEPEGWDGVRNFVARNNMMAMKKGDQAFFYHSNCKVPGIAGIMEIVREHSIDETAQNPKHPYYDPKATPEKPRWSLVHVEFRRKLPRLISLKELQKHKGPGGKLENLQTLNLSRLSVSKVSKAEWDFILSLLDEDEG